MKRIIALLLALLMCTAVLTSCARDEDTPPKGMILASADTEPFKLYVPEQMTSNVQSGISSAFSYVSENKKMIISARYYTPSAEMGIEVYMDYCASGYAKSLESFTLVSNNEAAVLSGVDARKMVYTAKIDETDYTCTQVSALYNGDMISLSFYIPTEVSEYHADTVSSVIKEFVLRERPAHTGDNFVDKKTPEGMKIASDKNLEYRFYVPSSWICDSKSGKSEAYYSESERSNVAVTSFSPDSNITLDEYITECKENYAKAIVGYELLEEERDLKVAERNAVSITYRASYDGVDYKLRQVIILYGNIFYSITYTATEANFDAHIDDFNKMVSVFIFR